MGPKLSVNVTDPVGTPMPEVPGATSALTKMTLPNGNVLFDVSACLYNAPTHFFVYNAGSNTLTQIPDVPNAAKDTSFATRFAVVMGLLF